MDGIVGNLKDGVRVIHPHHVLSMSRERALELLRDHGDEQDKHYAALMLAGPDLTMADIERLSGPRPPIKRSVAFTRFAIAGLLCAS